MKKTVSVTGGSGSLGQTLLRYLLKNFHVKALFRQQNTESQRWQQKGCEIVLGNLSDEAALTNLVTGAEFVFHCAALTASLSRQAAHETNVEGTRRLALASAKSGCKRFIHVSSNAVYQGADIRSVPKRDISNQGVSQGACYTEEIEIKANPEMELYCLTKILAEEVLKHVAHHHDLQYVILRPTCIYGPGVISYTLGPINAIKSGSPAILGDGNGLLDLVYVDDVARALILAAQSPEANGEIFNLGGETLTYNELYGYYGQMLNKSARHLPKTIAMGVAHLATLHREYGKSFKWYIELQENTCKYSSTKIRALLGYSPQFPLSIGLLRTELWLRDNNYIPQNSRILENADSLYCFSPYAIVHPKTEAEIVQVIQLAAAKGLKVKTIGAIHSLAPIPTTSGVCIALDNYRGVININVEDSLVTVQAGIKIWELNEVLAQYNLALPTLGTIDQQTVSGAISTGTHGGSLHHQSLSGYVQAIRLVRADSTVIEVDCSQDLFYAIGLSLGLLGIISTVTFKCAPAFSLQTELCQMPIDVLLQEFDELQKQNKYVDIRYTPITGNTQVALINTTEATLKESCSLHPINKTKLKQKLTHVINETALRLFASHKFNWLQRWGLKQHDKQGAYSSVSGRSDFVLTHFDASTNDLDSKAPKLSAADMEIGIPYSQSQTALVCLRDYFQESQRYPAIHVHIRCSAAEDFWLSPAYQQPTCWLEFWEYPRTGEFFQDIVEVLKPFNFRCHWAKDMPVEPDYVKKQYERWHDFIHLRQEWDANAVFTNKYLDHYFVS